MTDFLLKHFVKDYENVGKVSVRTAYGVLSSMVGIICNVILFVVKFVIGFIIHSVSVTADAFNNLSDAGSSIISFIGVKVAEMPADKNHPFGHGRAEYISALIVAFLVIQVGLTCFKDSFGKIRSPEIINFQIISVIILLLSMAVKLWLGIFNRTLGEKIDSKVLKAVFTDSMGDVMTTAATVFSIIFYAVTDINIDGIIGIGVSVVVMWAGVDIARDTLEPLLGEAIDPEVYNKIKDFVESYDGIEGSHDLIVHNYGPNRSMASIHAEVPNNVNIEKSHEIIDRIERESMEYLGIFLVVHMDPIETVDKEVLRLKNKLMRVLASMDKDCTVHDFRVVEGEKQTNLIFDMIVPRSYDEEEKDRLEKELTRSLQEPGHVYKLVITMEHSFLSTEDKKD